LKALGMSERKEDSMLVRISSLVVVIGLASVACAASPEPTANAQKAESTKGGDTKSDTSPSLTDPGTGASTTPPSTSPSPSATATATTPPAGASTANLATCCGSRGRCVPNAAVGASFQGDLDACPQAGTMCVPTEFVEDPAHKGKPCSGGVDLGATKLPYAGVCLSDCLNIESKELLSKDGCNSGELCVPCSNPLTGAPTGAPGCS
jgi:hypothetical protein